MPSGKDNLLDALLKQTHAYYLSDLRKQELHPQLASALAGIADNAYSLREWNEAVSYIFPNSPVFETAQAAKDYMTDRMQTPQ